MNLPIKIHVMGCVRSSTCSTCRKMAQKRNLLSYFKIISMSACSEASNPDSGETTEIGNDDEQVMNEPKKAKLKYDHVFQKEWLDDWPWLRYDDKWGMSCAMCKKHRKNNAMTGCRIWSWSPVLCEKHGPRDSVDKNRGRRPKFLSLLRPEGHVFHTARETMIKSYYSTLSDRFFPCFIHINMNFSALKWAIFGSLHGC